MKRLFIILLVLCPYISYGHLQAQMYSTSSHTHRSYSTGGTIAVPSHVEFRSTSVYNSNMRPNTQQKCYSTAPMQVANGSIKTMASSIQGGVLTNSEHIGPSRIQGRQNSTMEPPIDTTAPIGDGWDVALLLGLLCAGYVVFRYRKQRENQLS